MSDQVGTRTADRIYYDDQQLTEFTATVTAIREVARVDGRQVWQMALDRTAFYPESGGQPFDTGTLTATARSGATLAVPVTDVQEDAAGEVWHTSAKPLQEGTAVHGWVDNARRHDHMQQHTGQHLLSAVLWRDLALKTVSFHLGAEDSTIDLEGKLPSGEALFAAETAVNAVIAQALPVRVRTVPAEEAQQMLQDGRVRKLPLREGDIRLVEIPGIDLNACGGTHVSTTAEIGPVLLRGSERVRGVLRLHFLCGARALRAARSDYEVLTALAGAMSTGASEIGSAIEKLHAENRAAAKERAALLQALAEAEASATAAVLENPPAFLLREIDPTLPGRTPEYIRLLASALAKNGSARRVLLALPQGERCAVAFAALPGECNCGAELQAALQGLDGRGGGGRDLAQGSLPLNNLPALAAALQH